MPANEPNPGFASISIPHVTNTTLCHKHMKMSSQIQDARINSWPNMSSRNRKGDVYDQHDFTEGDLRAIYDITHMPS